MSITLHEPVPETMKIIIKLYDRFKVIVYVDKPLFRGLWFLLSNAYYKEMEYIAVFPEKHILGLFNDIIASHVIV